MWLDASIYGCCPVGRAVVPCAQEASLNMAPIQRGSQPVRPTWSHDVHKLVRDGFHQVLP